MAKANEPTLATVLERLEQLESALLKLLQRRLHQKVYPQIAMPTSGGLPIPRNLDLFVSVNSNVRQNHTHEVAVIDETSGATVGMCVAPVTFATGINPGTATITAALLGNLAADTDYLLVCRKVAGVTMMFIDHQVAIRTAI